MARADRRSAQRASRTSASRGGIRASGQASAVEQTLFFTRIRRRAKWVFVFLALAFGVGFVVFGVGSNTGGGGIGDILQGGSASPGGPSVGDAQKKVDANPRDPAALRDLATALQNDGRPDEAVPILERYSRVQPKDVDALNELAALYQSRAARERSQAQLAQLRMQLAAPETELLPPPTTPLGKAIGDLPISNAVSAEAQAEFNEKLGSMQASYRQATTVYERIVVLDPDDATAQQNLGYAAMFANDNATAIAAFKRFLELAPDDDQAPIIKQQLKQLEAAPTAPLSTTG